jgi:hypothetical protein
MRLLAVVMAPETSSRSLHLLPFGIPTVIIAEDPQLLAAAGAAYAYWLAEAPLSDPALELRLETGRASPSEVSFGISVEGSRLRLSGGGIDGAANAVTGAAQARVPPALAHDSAVLAEVTDTLLLFLLARRGRTPVHASAFMLGDVAVVLAGASGSGKSTLALAAALRGLPILSDDMVFVQRDPSFTVWGFPRPIHVFAEDSPPGVHPTRQRNDKMKNAVATSAVALRAEAARLVLLQRGDKLALTPVDRAGAVESLMALDPGFDLLEEESREAIGQLASGGAWTLTLERDPRAAIDFLTGRLPLAADGS